MNSLRKILAITLCILFAIVVIVFALTLWSNYPGYTFIAIVAVTLMAIGMRYTQKVWK
jgi:uncharacterized membrane protein